MTCFCLARLESFSVSLAGMPSLAGLVPPMSFALAAVAAASVGSAPGFGLVAAGSATATATASAVANLSAMASFSAALKATTGASLGAALSASAVASVQARLTASIDGFNAHAGFLNGLTGQLQSLLAELTNLLGLAGLVSAARVAFGIDLRSAGAVAALSARLSLAAQARAAASVSGTVSVQATAVASLMATLGFKADAVGALAAGAQAQALAGLVARLPSIGSGFGSLSLLSALVAMLAAIRAALGVNLLAPSAAVDLRLALSALPLAGLAQLGASASATATASASATASLVASAGANAAASLDLSAVARAQLSAVGQLSMLLQAMAQGGFGLPPGACGGPCPLVVPAFAARLSGVADAPAALAAPAGRLAAGAGSFQAGP